MSITRHSALYERTLRSQRFALVRRVALKRAGYRCEVCGVGDVLLQAHHRSSYASSLGRERASDLIMVCGPCHRLAEWRRLLPVEKVPRQDEPGVYRMMGMVVLGCVVLLVVWWLVVRR